MTVNELQPYIAPGRRAHLVGIGGISMSPLAEVLHGAGMVITGSDMRESPAVEHLRSLGIPVSIGHRAENLGEAELVIRTAAVHDENPEIAAARATGIPVFERAAAISGLSSWTAAVRMTHPAPWTLSPRWPMTTGIPRERRCSTVSLSCISEPVIVTPAPWSTSARGDMDTPPMPTRWAWAPGRI